MSNTYASQQAARNIGGVIGRALVRALRIQSEIKGDNTSAVLATMRRRDVERGRVEGARTVAVCLAYQFGLDDGAFDADEFYQLVLDEAYRAYRGEWDKAPEGTTNFYRTWVFDQPWASFGNL
jgi:hypothetical protein